MSTDAVRAALAELVRNFVRAVAIWIASRTNCSASGICAGVNRSSVRHLRESPRDSLRCSSSVEGAELGNGGALDAGIVNQAPIRRCGHG